MSGDEIADRLQGFAVQRFDEHGPHDARGAALWDAAEWLRGVDLDAAIERETQPWRVIRSERGFGWHLWLGRLARVNSPGALTPMWPHVYRSGDEHCNPVLAVHLWPVGGLDVWWRGHKRTEADGPCDDCIRDMADE